MLTTFSGTVGGQLRQVSLYYVSTLPCPSTQQLFPYNQQACFPIIKKKESGGVDPKIPLYTSLLTNLPVHSCLLVCILHFISYFNTISTMWLQFLFQKVMTTLWLWWRFTTLRSISPSSTHSPTHFEKLSCNCEICQKEI